MKLKIYTFLFLMQLIGICVKANNTANCIESSASINLYINNVRAKLLNGGDKFWDIFDSRDGAYEIPKGSGINSSFASALWLSGIDASNNLYTAGQTYRQTGIDFWPGALDNFGNTSVIDCKDGDKLFSVYGTEIIASKAGKHIAYNINRWPSLQAPFYDANSDGIYDPTLGDYPVLNLNHSEVIPGQMVFGIYNDKGGIHTAFPGENSLGVEIHTTAYAFASNLSDAINNTIFYRYKIINKSSNTYTEFRMGEFNDADLGNSTDDYVGCDLSTNNQGKKRNLFYTYNADNLDEDGISKGYGLAPPSYGITFLELGKKNDGTSFEMGSFLFQTNEAVPGIPSLPHPLELHRNLKGIWNDGKHLAYGKSNGRDGNDTCFFAFPGKTDPKGRPNWVETGLPGDRRMLPATAARTMLPGQQFTIELAYVWARDLAGTNLTSLEKLRLTTDTVISAFNANFNNFSTGIKVQKNVLKLYPNPTTDFITMEGLGEIISIRIYNSQGKLVKQIQKPTSSKINITGLPQGTYIIQADEFVGRFVKL